jgi:K+-sensing histidine kinase KdpD
MVLAEDLGARVRVVEARDVGQAIADLAREEHVTLIVMRHVRETGWRRLRGETLVDELLQRLDNVDIHLIETTSSKR